VFSRLFHAGTGTGFDNGTGFDFNPTFWYWF
jgi:hypothetical protein